jgi:hypothetical protein
MIAFRTLCARLRAVIKAMDPAARAALGPLPSCVARGSSYSYRVDADAFIALCARVGLCPLTGERITPLPEPAALCLQTLGAGCAVKRHLENLECEALARRLGIGRTTLWRLEKGMPTSIEVILAVCDFIGVHPFGYLRRERKAPAALRRAA